MQFAWLLCVFGNVSVASVPVVGLVPVVSVTVPLTPSHTWLVAHAIDGLVPAAAPAAIVIVPVPMMNFPCRKPVAVVFPLPVTWKAAVEEFEPPSYTMNPLVPDPLVLFTTTAFAPAPALIVVFALGGKIARSSELAASVTRR